MADDALAAPPSDPLDADFRQNVQDIRGSIAARQETAAEKAKALAPLREAQLAQVRQPLPQPPQTQQPPAAPKRNEPGADEQWMMTAGVLGAIAGGVTRNHATNALAAVTGAMEGYQAGSKQKFDENLKIWDAENTKIQETNKAANDRYLQILQSQKLALEQKSQEIQMVAAQFDDKAAMQLAQTHDYETLGRLIQQRQQQGERMQMQRERLIQQKQAADARVEAARLRATAGAAPANQDAINMRVEMALTGNPNAYKGMRAGTPEYQAFSQRLAEVAKERGIPAEKLAQMQTSYAGETSYQRSAGTMSARVENAVNEVDQLLPQALEASRNLPRGKFVPANQLKQRYQAGTSDPAYNDFLMANFALEKAYGRAMNPQGVPRVQEAEEAKAAGILSTANSQQAYEVQLRRLKIEVEASKRATQMTRSGVREPAVSPAGAPPPPRGSADMPIPPPSGDMLEQVRSKLPPGWSAEPVQ